MGAVLHYTSLKGWNRKALREAREKESDIYQMFKHGAKYVGAVHKAAVAVDQSDIVVVDVGYRSENCYYRGQVYGRYEIVAYHRLQGAEMKDSLILFIRPLSPIYYARRYFLVDTLIYDNFDLLIVPFKGAPNVRLNQTISTDDAGFVITAREFEAVRELIWQDVPSAEFAQLTAAVRGLDAVVVIKYDGRPIKVPANASIAGRFVWVSEDTIVPYSTVIIPDPNKPVVILP